jgi:hypothetical protein
MSCLCSELILYIKKVEGKVHPCTGTEALYRPIGGVEVQLYSFMTTALEGVRGQRHAPAALYPRERPGTHCTEEAGWATGPVWTGAETLAPTGIRSRTVQPVSSRCSDYATRPTYLYDCVYFVKFFDHT